MRQNFWVYQKYSSKDVAFGPFPREFNVRSNFRSCFLALRRKDVTRFEFYSDSFSDGNCRCT